MVSLVLFWFSILRLDFPLQFAQHHFICFKLTSFGLFSGSKIPKIYYCSDNEGFHFNNVETTGDSPDIGISFGYADGEQPNFFVKYVKFVK